MTNREINVYLIVAGYTTFAQEDSQEECFLSIFCDRRKGWVGNYTEEGRLYYRNCGGVYQSQEATRDINRILELLDA